MNEAVTGIILAGGRSSRMGGIDKGLLKFEGKPLVAHVIDRVALQVDHLVISANRNMEIYRSFGFPVVQDELDGFHGPLAGIVAAGGHTTTGLLLIAPCDMPQLPVDLCHRLRTSLENNNADIAVAHDGMRSQHLCMLFRRPLLDDMENYLIRGERKVMNWIERYPWVEVDFSENREAFDNINYLDY